MVSVKSTADVEKPSCLGAASSSAVQRGSTKTSLHLPGNIVFVRNRMLYSRAALNASGEVRFGLRHIRANTTISTESSGLIVSGRCFESISRTYKLRAYFAYHEVYFSTSVWTTQCLHIHCRSQRDSTVIQGLHPPGARDSSSQTSRTLKGRHEGHARTRLQVEGTQAITGHGSGVDQ